jgi:GTP-binding protein HflX
LLFVDGKLSPVQQRNLERALKCKVIDRTALILEIFGRRAQTAEGRLQVELAALEYQKSRLVRSWTHLERQRGGFGFMGGPGESQLELDKRMLGERIQSIRKALFHVQRTRTLQRKARQKVPFPVVALVGYTNAGKSTLFNRLTNAHVRVADLLFATLDPTLRHIHLLSGKKVIVSDTVGFISDLPTTLVAAFRATLEEVVEADVLLHIVDVSHPEWVHQKQDVEKVLAELGRPTQQPVIEVWNKVDQLSDDARASLQQQATQKVAQQASPPVVVSALRGEGIPQLLREIETICDRFNKIYRVKGSFADGKLWGWLYDHGTIVGNASEEDRYSLDVMLSAKNKARLDTLFPQAPVEDLLT